MLAELKSPPMAIRGHDLDAPQPLPNIDPRVTVDPDLRDSFRALGLTTPEAFLDIPGEIVAGHPDRHVMRVVLGDGRAGYLKREHRIRWSDRFRNWRAGYGWVSKSVREGCTLQYFESWGFPSPRWLAFGEDSQGRAFLLVEEVPGARDLRRVVRDTDDPQDLAVCLGRFCAELHEAGFDHPDLYAKHFLVNPTNGAITLLDWQRTEKRDRIGWKKRARALAALLATLPEPPKTLSRGHFQWEFLRGYLAAVRDGGTEVLPSATELAYHIQVVMKRLERRRGIREQRQIPLPASAQRLVWLDGEALCSLPEVAGDLRWHSVQTVLYDRSRHGCELVLSGNRRATLNSTVHALSLDWLWAEILGKSWRSPQLRLARLLFHLERHHVAAPKLLAFGQRFRGDGRCEAFLLRESVPPSAVPFTHALSQLGREGRSVLLDWLADILYQLHEAGCEIGSIDRIVVDGPALLVAEPGALKFRKHLSDSRRMSDLRGCLRSITNYCETDELEQFFRIAAGPR